MNKIDIIRQMISENRHADALMNYCMGDFSGDEYTQADREQVALWKVECIIGTIAIADLGAFNGQGKVHEHLNGHWEYNPKYENEVEILEKFLFALKPLLDAVKTKAARIKKFEKFRDYVLNIVLERFKKSLKAYSERINGSSAWEVWRKFNLGINFLDVVIGSYMTVIGKQSIDESIQFKSIYNMHNMAKDRIDCLWNCSDRLNKLYEDITVNDVVQEINEKRVEDLLLTVVNIESFIIDTLADYEGQYLQNYTNAHCILVKKKVKAAFLLTYLNTGVNTSNGGYRALIVDQGYRDQIFNDLIGLEKEIRLVEPGYSCSDKAYNPKNSNNAKKGGCYVATAVYGSYNCPQVWTLRRYRDNTLAKTWYGRLFIKTYYAISPTLVKWFGHTEWFKKMWKGKLDRLVYKLQTNGVEATPYEDKNW